MEFCPKCGAVLVQKKNKFGCARCNYSAKTKTKLITSEKIEKKAKLSVLKEKDIDILPIVTEDCPKCPNDKAYFWTVQTRAADESETKFFKCTECKHTKRDYR